MSAGRRATLSMETNLESCPSSSLQTSSTDSSEALEYRGDRRMTQRFARPGPGGFRPDGLFPYRGQIFGGNGAPTRASPSSHNHLAYSWGPPRTTTTAVGGRGESQYGRGNGRYAGGFPRPFTTAYRGRGTYGTCESRSEYDYSEFSSDTGGSWEDIQNAEYGPQWLTLAGLDDFEQQQHYRQSGLHAGPSSVRQKKHVPLNRQGVPDSVVDSSVCRSLHQGCHKGRFWRKITVRTSYSSRCPRTLSGRPIRPDVRGRRPDVLFVRMSTDVVRTFAHVRVYPADGLLPSADAVKNASVRTRQCVRTDATMRPRGRTRICADMSASVRTRQCVRTDAGLRPPGMS
jgi:hypothetical protein